MPSDLTKQQAKALLRRNWLSLKRDKVNFYPCVILPPLLGFALANLQPDDHFMRLYYFPLAIPISFLPHVGRLAMDAITDRAERFKETLKIMSLTQRAYLTGVLLYAYLISVFPALVFVICFYIQGLITDFAELSLMGLSLLLCGVAVTNASMTLSVLFKKPMTGLQVINLIVVVLLGVALAVCNSEFTEHSKYLWILASLFPTNCLAFAVYTIVNAPSPQIKSFYTIELTVALQIVNSVLYFLLYLYLEEVVPDSFGTKRDFLFCLKRKRSDGAQYSQVSQAGSGADTQRSVELSLSERLRPSGDLDSCATRAVGQGGATQYSDSSSARFHEKLSESELPELEIRVHDLCKFFGPVSALTTVSFPIYKGQVFCLLGHNGAGKTTTINLLTGNLERNAGTIEVKGVDANPSTLELIRRNYGVCQQTDVVYEKLTVEEHLSLVADIKGVPPERRHQEVQDVIARCGLSTEWTKEAGTLSGGNKRKMNLAMAIIGGSGIVFLDEPTSGMDPVSRRLVWDVVRELRRENKTIILTTHMLDEAEELADRIAIMSRGELLILGTADFIKKTFGEGYRLEIKVNDGAGSTSINEERNRSIDRAVEVILSHIPDAEIDAKARSSAFLQVVLPFKSQEKFSSMFKQLERIEHISLSLEMNSLEDVFVKIGVEEEQHFLNQLRQEANQTSDLASQGTTDSSSLEFNINNHNGSPQDNIPLTTSPLGNRRPTYSFSAQFKAMFHRRVLLAKRDHNTYIGAVLLLLVPVGFSGGSFLIPEGYFAVAVLMAFMISYSVNLGINVAAVVAEREASIKHIIKCMGCRPTPYWLGTLAIEFAIFLLILIFFLGILAGIGVDLYKNIQTVLLIPSMVLYGFSSSIFAHCIGFLFQKANSVLYYYPLVDFAAFGGPLFVEYLLGNFPQVQTVWTYAMYCCFPTATILSNIGETYRDKPALSNQAFIAFFLAQIFVLSTLIHVLETRKPKKEKVQINSTESAAVRQDEDVLREQNRIVSGGANDPIIVRELHKVYPITSLHAFQGLSFGTPKGEIFGLLGPNGAGKSTVFGVLTGVLAKSSGSVKLRGQETESFDPEVFQEVGLCGQSNGLWEKVTVEEHLRVFGLMKGLREQERELETVVGWLMGSLGLRDFRATKAGDLSGGNKRKLCVALSLIGCPSVLLLDEPTTGVDAGSRKKIWSVVESVMRARGGGGTVMVATHSMIEAEAVCKRIGMVVNGRFVCFGEVEALRKKFGAGYNLVIRESVESSVQAIDEAVKARLPSAVRLGEDNPGLVSYQVPFESFLISEAFNLLFDELKERGVIEDFSVSQCRLEQMFLYFARGQTQPVEAHLLNV